MFPDPLDVEFNVRSLEDIHTLIFEKVSKIEGIIATETSVVLRFAKRRYDWGTGLPQDDEA